MAIRQVCGLWMAVALASCGSGGSEGAGADKAGDRSPAAAGGAADPCRLVTAEELTAILKEQIVATKPGEGSCEYQTADAMASSVTVELDQSDAAGAMATARQAAGALKDIGGAVSSEGGAGADTNALLSEGGDAPKLGDEAFFGPNQQLSIRKGASYVAITPPMMRSRMAGGNPMLSSEEKRAIAVAIAEKALPRLR